MGDTVEIFNKHFIRIDEQKYILSGFSDAFENPTETDILINDRGGRHFQLVLGSKLTQENPPLIDDWGTPLYEWNDKRVVRRTNEEIEFNRIHLSIPSDDFCQRFGQSHSIDEVVSYVMGLDISCEDVLQNSQYLCDPRLVPVLINIVQEQQKRIDKLEQNKTGQGG